MMRTDANEKEEEDETHDGDAGEGDDDGQATGRRRGGSGVTHPRPPLDVVAGQLAGVLVVVALGHQRVHDGHQLADAGAVGLAPGHPRDLVAPHAAARLLLPRHHLAVVEHAVAVQAAHLRPNLVRPALACKHDQHSFSVGITGPHFLTSS